MTSEYIRMVINLGLVLLLMFVLVYFLKKFKGSKLSNNKYIKIINIVSIGPKEKLILVEANNVTLLIGSTPNQIETLHTYESANKSKSFDEHLSEVAKLT